MCIGSFVAYYFFYNFFGINLFWYLSLEIWFSYVCFYSSKPLESQTVATSNDVPQAIPRKHADKTINKMADLSKESFEEVNHPDGKVSL